MVIFIVGLFGSKYLLNQLRFDMHIIEAIICDQKIFFTQIPKKGAADAP